MPAIFRCPPPAPIFRDTARCMLCPRRQAPDCMLNVWPEGAARTEIRPDATRGTHARADVTRQPAASRD